MRRRSIFLILSLIILGVFSLYLIPLKSMAQPKDNMAKDNVPSDASTGGGVVSSNENYDELIKKGVWRDGKAVFSDWLALDFLMNENLRRGYRPTQPINFSHQLHVEKNKMECQYCHSAVAKNAYASLPSVETCMGCHKLVKTDSPEIKKLTEYWSKGEPVPWEKVHKLPQHAHFSHKRHIKAGVGCQACHGQIQKMPVVEKVSSLKMGFCISCHRENGASIDCSTCHY